MDVRWAMSGNMVCRKEQGNFSLRIFDFGLGTMLKKLMEEPSILLTLQMIDKYEKLIFRVS